MFFFTVGGEVLNGSRVKVGGEGRRLGVVLVAVVVVVVMVVVLVLVGGEMLRGSM